MSGFESQALPPAPKYTAWPSVMCPVGQSRRGPVASSSLSEADTTWVQEGLVCVSVLGFSTASLRARAMSVSITDHGPPNSPIPSSAGVEDSGRMWTPAPAAVVLEHGFWRAGGEGQEEAGEDRAPGQQRPGVQWRGWVGGSAGPTQCSPPPVLTQHALLPGPSGDRVGERLAGRHGSWR